MLALTKPRPAEGEEWRKGMNLVEMPEPALPDGDHVLVDVIAAGICGTDVSIYSSRESVREEMLSAEADPIIIGHEFAGGLLEIGDGALEYIGGKLEERADDSLKLRLMNDYDVTAEMHITCGECLQCRLGEKHVCKNTIIKGLHRHGAFTKYLTIPAENLVLIPKGDIPLEVMAFMDAIGNAVHTVMAMSVEGKKLAILGCGVQGLMATAIARQLGAEKIYVTDASHPKVGMTHERLEETHFTMARQFGAAACYDMAIRENRRAFVEFVMDETNGIGVDGVLEMSGNYKAYEDAFKVVRSGGTFSLLGLPNGKKEIDFTKEVIFKGLTMKGIIGREVWETWDRMIEILKDGLSDVFTKNGFITHDLPLADYEHAFNEIFSGGALKVIFRP